MGGASSYEGDVRGVQSPPLAPFLFSLGCQIGHVRGYPYPISGNVTPKNVRVCTPPPPATFSGLAWHHDSHPIDCKIPPLTKSCVRH